MRTDSRGAVIERRNEAPLTRDTVPRQPQWEYRTATMDLDADLSQYGSEGWELVSVVVVPHDPMTAVFHLKRRRQ